MKLDNKDIEQYRIRTGLLHSDETFGNNGAFEIRLGCRILYAIVSDGEEWMPVRNYQDLYEVSNKGRVRAFSKVVNLPNGAKRIHDLHVLSQEKMKRGYFRVSLCRDSSMCKILVHRLVAESFIQNPQNFPEINHRDGDKFNNFATNLEWCSRQYNNHHAIELGLRTGLSSIDIIKIKKLLALGQTSNQIAKSFSKSRQTISDIKCGRSRNLSPELPTGYWQDLFWEHVSVSLKQRCPTWDEMCFVKDLFWADDEVVIQYHPAKSNYVNDFKTCLHLWKPIGVELPTPEVKLI